MAVEQVKTVIENLSKFMVFGAKEHDFIQVTKWTNGEGWYININDDQIFSLHIDELSAINYLTKMLEYEKL